MTKQADILIIFARNPVRGKVKTRLAAAVGDDMALSVYEELLGHTKTVVQKLKVDKIICYSDQVEVRDIWEGDFLKAQQQGADLGERMLEAFKYVFRLGYIKAVIIGTDCPSLDERIICEAFKSLDNNEIVVGPAFDGGYYLLGMTKLHKQLFNNVEWSTPVVFETTVHRCTALNLRYHTLPCLHDVDELKDLVHLKTIRI